VSSCHARGCTDVKTGVISEIRKTEGRTVFDLVHVSGSSSRLPIKLPNCFR